MKKDLRIRKNFMIRTSVLQEMESLIPKGEWSQFVDNALEQAMTDFSRNKGRELLKQFKEEHSSPISNEEIYQMIRNDRQF